MCCLPVVQMDCAHQNSLELLAQGEVNEEVDGGIEDKREMVEACQTKKPRWRL